MVAGWGFVGQTWDLDYRLSFRVSGYDNNNASVVKANEHERQKIMVICG